MGQKTFESSQGWFELTYPQHWTSFEEEDGTYLFMDNEDWKGNLRITSMRFETADKKEQTEKVKKGIKDELEKRTNSKLIKLGDKDAVFWTKEIEQDGDSLIIYNWTTGDKGTLLICSFAIDKDKADQKRIKDEFDFALKTMESIRVR